jgi:hypothetical protein
MEIKLYAGNTEEQAKIMRWFLQHTTSRHMYWLVQIILKNVKVRCICLCIHHPLPQNMLCTCA